MGICGFNFLFKRLGLDLRPSSWWNGRQPGGAAEQLWSMERKERRHLQSLERKGCSVRSYWTLFSINGILARKHDSFNMCVCGATPHRRCSEGLIVIQIPADRAGTQT